MSGMLAGGAEWWFTESGAQRNSKPQRETKTTPKYLRRFGLEEVQVCLRKITEVAYSQKGDNFGNNWFSISTKENNGITVQGKVDMVLE